MTATRSPRIYRDFDPNVGGGVDRDTLDASDFAGKNRSFPIDKPGDVDDAWHSVGRAKDNYPIPTLMLNIIKIAKAKGPRFIAHLPDPNDDQDPKVQAALKAAKGSLKGSEISAYFLERAALLAAEAVADDAKPAQPDDDDDDDDEGSDQQPAADDDAGDAEPDDDDDEDQDAEDGDEAPSTPTRAQASGPSSAYHQKLVSLLKPMVHPTAFQRLQTIARGHAGGKALKGTTKAAESAGYQPAPYHQDPDEDVQCPRCHKMNDTDARYCDQCGFHLQGAEGVTVDGKIVASETRRFDYGLQPAPLGLPGDDMTGAATEALLDDRDFDDVDDDDKAAKQLVKFRPATKVGQQCGTCRFFQPDCNACKLIEGYVTTNDLCDLYTPLTIQGGEHGLLSLVASERTANGPKRGQLALFNEIDTATPPSWIPVLPKPGSYRHPRYGQIDLTSERNAHFIDNFNQQVYQADIPIDAEHETKLSGALGYYRELRQNADGSVDARVEYTPRGQQLVSSGQFRYFSPELYDEWEDPATGSVHRDVLIGGAFTTRPFFKDPSLRPLPLVASELTRIDVPDRSTRMSVTMTEQQFHEALAASEQKVALMETTIKAMQTEARRQKFAETVRDWSGEPEQHISLMEHIADTAGEDSELFQEYIRREQAHAEQLRVAGLFSEKGTSQRGGASPAEQVAAKTALLLNANPTMNPADAQARVFSENPGLYEQYRRASIKRDLAE